MPMRLGRIVHLVLAFGATAVVLLVSGPPAHAQSSTTSTTPDEVNRGWACEPAPLPGEVTPPGEPGRVQCKMRTMVPERPSRSEWTPFLAAMGWVVVPMLLAVWIAAGRDESVVIAIVLTFILGWIGLLLVWGFLGRRRRDEAALRLDA